MEVRILGPLEVVHDDRTVDLPRGRARSLLGLLALHPGEVIATDRLVDQLWGDQPPRTAATALQGLVSKLRKRLEPDRGRDEAPTVLRTQASGYVLDLDHAQVDANRFRHLVKEATGAAPAAERAVRLRAALELWRGPALADFTYEPFAQSAITALEELRLTALEERIDVDLALGRHAELVAELEGLLTEHPLRERLRGHLMLALYRSGRQADALKAYRDARRVLVDELGIEPGRTLEVLHEAVLRQALSLDLGSRHGELGEGAQVAPPAEAVAWLPPGRKTATVVFVDLAESSGLAGGSDPEALRRMVARSLETASEVFRRHGGSVKGFIGDVIVAVFGIPVAHEDDALRAVRATIEVRESVATLNRELERNLGTQLLARVGVNTGEVVVGDPGAGEAEATGGAVKMAAQLQQAAAGGEVLLGEATRRMIGDAALVEPVVLHGLEGQTQRLTVWRLAELVPDAPPRALDLETRFVGRAAELARLHTAFDEVVLERRAAAMTVVGEAGIGKSRLAREFTAALGEEARVLSGRCPAYGEGITFWPLREVVLDAAGDRGPDDIRGLLAGQADAESTVAQVTAGIGLANGAVQPERLFPAVRQLFEALAGERPVVVVLEDVHWAQPTFLDLVEYLAESIQRAVLLLCLARPEPAEEGPSSTASRPRALSLVIQPLDVDTSRRLVVDRSAGQLLPAETRERIVELAQGNPLFLEQLLAALRDGKDLSLPPSVQALLAARLDRLGPAERDLLRTASVLGVDIPGKALISLVPQAARPYVGTHLEALRRKELMVRSSRPFLGGPAFAFRHALIQVAAYRSTTRQDRAELHERFAAWLDDQAGDRALELEEVVGHHLEQAHGQRRQMGLLDGHTYRLAVRAGERLASAGLRAYARFDVAAVANLLSRARALLPADHQRHREIARPLAEAYQPLGRHRDADAVLAEMLEVAVADGDLLPQERIRLERVRIRLITGPDPATLDAIHDEADRARRTFKASGDDAVVADAAYVLGLVHLRRGKPREMEQVARHGLSLAVRSGSPRGEAAMRWWVALALVEGPTWVPDCLRECEDFLCWHGYEHPGVLAELARLRAMQGEGELARELIARARTLFVERVGGRRPLMFIAQRQAEVELLAGGDDAMVEDQLRTAYDLAIEFEERDQVAVSAATLSRLLARQERTDEAVHLASVSRARAPAESVTTRALSQVATARVLLGRDPRQAEHLAREAVELVPDDMLNLRAFLLAELAELLVAVGRRGDAQPMVEQAVDLYERKGNLVEARRAQELVR